MALSLLNIDREDEKDAKKIIDQVYEELDNFNSLLDTYEHSEIPASRMVILRNRMLDLQGSIATFGALTSIKMEKKSDIIFDLQPQLMMLSNRVLGIDAFIDRSITTCTSYLLYQLVSTAAAKPRNIVIGVSNILAQVLSMDIGVTDIPTIEKSEDDPSYFNYLANHFNYVITSAGLFAAPVVGLPNIPSSALGNYAEKALNQFGYLRSFIENNYSPLSFYEIDKRNHSTVKFDTTKDVISAFLFENEFLAELGARADLLSGLRFPGSLTEDGEAKVFSSVDDITNVLANRILSNCEKIEKYINLLYDMFNKGTINKNDNPKTDFELNDIIIQVKTWRTIANLGKLMVKIFNGEESDYTTVIDFKDELPELADQPVSNELELYAYLQQMLNTLKHLSIAEEEEIAKFAQTSQFSVYRTFLKYTIYIVSLHDLKLQSKSWTVWFFQNYNAYFKENVIQYFPVETLMVAESLLFQGLFANNDKLIATGRDLMMCTEPFLEFQFHHTINIKVLSTLLSGRKLGYGVEVGNVQKLIPEFLQTYEIDASSMLNLRLMLYGEMLKLFKEMNVFIRKQNERLVPFDIFSWIQLPIDAEQQIPWIPLNTAIENLNVG